VRFLITRTPTYFFYKCTPFFLSSIFNNAPERLTSFSRLNLFTKIVHETLSILASFSYFLFSNFIGCYYVLYHKIMIDSVPPWTISVQDYNILHNTTSFDDIMIYSIIAPHNRVSAYIIIMRRHYLIYNINIIIW
jgi:hypothetical protein